MRGQSRRRFVGLGAAALSAGVLALQSERAFGLPLGLPLGLQLYCVRELLAKDYDGTLKQIAGLGYSEVEAAGFFEHTPQQVNAAMQAAGLRLVSAHYNAVALQKDLDQIIAYGKAVGLQYIICSFPGFREPSQLKDKSYRGQVQALRLDDFRWTADRLNEWGAKVKAAGMQLGYHNYTMEFPPQDGVVPFDELLRLTDPKLVTFEMDCGWVVMGGGDPAAYLRRYPTRISLLHVKDFKPATQPVTIVDVPPPAELGRGTQDLRRVFEAAKHSAVRHCFVEQEGFDMPPMASLRVDAEYMRGLKG